MQDQKSLCVWSRITSTLDSLPVNESQNENIANDFALWIIWVNIFKVAIILSENV